jgi:hypothetical protein
MLVLTVLVWFISVDTDTREVCNLQVILLSRSVDACFNDVRGEWHHCHKHKLDPYKFDVCYAASNVVFPGQHMVVSPMCVVGPM